MTRLIGLALLALAGVAATGGGNHGAGNVRGEGRTSVEVLGVPDVFPIVRDAGRGDGGLGAPQQEPHLARNSKTMAFRLDVPFLAADGIATPEPAASPTNTPVNRDPYVTVTPEPTRDAPVYGAGVESIIRDYDWPDDYAIAVAWCESKFDAHAYNPASGASGVMQLIPFWHASRLRPGESWFDGATNVRVAYELWREQGWQPWNVGGCP